MQNPKLSQGAIESIMRGENPAEKPVLQLLNHKRISSGGSQERYRVIISDGIHFNSYAMLATQLNDKVKNGELPEYTIISLDQFVLSNLPAGKGGSGTRKVLIILNLSVLVHGTKVGMKIGSPQNYDDAAESTQVASTPSEPPQSSFNSRPMVNGSPRSFGGRAAQNNGNTSVYNGNSSMLENVKNVLPIVALNPYQNRWVIKARVVNKSNIRTWSNARTEGKLFSVDLMDESGGIRATAFTDVCDKFHEMLEMNKVYYISRCQIKPANKKFTTLPHDFELTFNQETQAVLCQDDDSSIPQLQFNFTPLSTLKDIAPDSLVDIAGVCRTANDIQTLFAKTTKRELKKRDIVLVDQTDASVTVTLWDKLAEDFNGDNSPVVAIRGGRLTEFNGGKSISIGNSCSVQINPDIPKAHQLRGWFDSLSDSHQFSNVSLKTGGDGSNAKMWTMQEIRMNNVGCEEKADYLNMESTVMFIQSDKALYNACPNADCKKKVLDQNDGTFRCEKCNQTFPTFTYRLMLNVQFCDWSGQHWVSMFQDQAEQFLGATAQTIGQTKEAYDGDYVSYFRKPLFKTYFLRVRAKVDTFNNESRLRLTVVNLKPIDYKDASKKLLQEIKTLSGVSVGSN